MYIMRKMLSPALGNFQRFFELIGNNGDFILEIPIVNEQSELTVKISV